MSSQRSSHCPLVSLEAALLVLLPPCLTVTQIVWVALVASSMGGHLCQMATSQPSLPNNHNNNNVLRRPLCLCQLRLRACQQDLPPLKLVMEDPKASYRQALTHLSNSHQFSHLLVFLHHQALGLLLDSVLRPACRQLSSNEVDELGIRWHILSAVSSQWKRTGQFQPSDHKLFEKYHYVRAELSYFAQSAG